MNLIIHQKVSQFLYLILVSFPELRTGFRNEEAVKKIPLPPPPKPTQTWERLQALYLGELRKLKKLLIHSS
jgi:hypothetical protein